MVANIFNIQKIYGEIPNVFIFEGVTMDNYKKSEHHFLHGWREVVIPIVTEYQKLSDEYVLIDDIVTKTVIDFTPEEIEAYHRSLIPKKLSKMQFEMQVLITTSIEWANIISFIESLVMSELYKKLLLIRLRRCTYLERFDEDLNTISFMMGITQEQLDEIFINGNLID